MHIKTYTPSFLQKRDAAHAQSPHSCTHKCVCVCVCVCVWHARLLMYADAGPMHANTLMRAHTGATDGRSVTPRMTEPSPSRQVLCVCMCVCVSVSLSMSLSVSLSLCMYARCTGWQVAEGIS